MGSCLQDLLWLEDGWSALSGDGYGKVAFLGYRRVSSGNHAKSGFEHTRGGSEWRSQAGWVFSQRGGLYTPEEVFKNPLYFDVFVRSEVQDSQRRVRGASR